MNDAIRTRAAAYFRETLRVHGPTPSGLDWNSAASQEIRFDQILKVLPRKSNLSLTDYGCGYGALAAYLDEKGYQVTYHGFDVCAEMIDSARILYGKRSNSFFYADRQALPRSDFTVASGIFNVRLGATDAEWRDYILSTIHEFDELSREGFAFNALTSYSDEDHQRPDLYYADPCWLFDYCKTHFSRNVALLHDYQLYDFTIIVRKQFPC